MAKYKKTKRRNSEKRKEKSRDAARCRRGKESEVFYAMAQQLPLPEATKSQLDKASVMRMAISQLQLRNIFGPSAETSCLKPNEFSSEDHLESMEGFVLILSMEGDMVYLSENVSKYLGLQQIELMGHSIFDYSHPCDHDEIQEVLSEKTDSSKKAERHSFSVRMKCTLTSKGKNINLKSAMYKVIMCTTHIMPDNKHTLAGQRNYLVTYCQPLTQQVNMTMSLDSHSFVTWHDMKLAVTACEARHMYRLTGYKESDVVNKSMYNFYHAADSPNVIHSFKDLFAKGQTRTGLYRFLAKNGGYVWMDSEITIIYNNRTEKPESVFCVNHVVSGIEEKGCIMSPVQLPSTETAMTPFMDYNANREDSQITDKMECSTVDSSPLSLTPAPAEDILPMFSLPVFNNFTSEEYTEPTELTFTDPASFFRTQSPNTMQQVNKLSLLDNEIDIELRAPYIPMNGEEDAMFPPEFIPLEDEQDTVFNKERSRMLGSTEGIFNVDPHTDTEQKTPLNVLRQVAQQQQSNDQDGSLALTGSNGPRKVKVPKETNRLETGPPPSKIQHVDKPAAVSCPPVSAAVSAATAALLAPSEPTPKEKTITTQASTTNTAKSVLENLLVTGEDVNYGYKLWSRDPNSIQIAVPSPSGSCSSSPYSSGFSTPVDGSLSPTTTPSPMMLEEVALSSVLKPTATTSTMIIQGMPSGNVGELVIEEVPVTIFDADGTRPTTGITTNLCQVYSFK